MEFAVVIHEAEEGVCRAEVPSIPGCATHGESFEELLDNIYEAVEGCLSVEIPAAICCQARGFSQGRDACRLSKRSQERETRSFFSAGFPAEPFVPRGGIFKLEKSFADKLYDFRLGFLPR